MALMTKRQMLEAEAEQRAARTTRHPMMSDTDINYILMNGAQIALSKMKRAEAYDDRLYYHAQISAYLEVSLSRGAGITDDTRDDLNGLYEEATHLYMEARRQNSKVEA
jgi:hypothetical protein